MVTINFNVSGNFAEMNAKLNNIMATLEQFKEQFDRMNAGLTNIKTDLDGLKNQIASLGLASSVEDELLESITAIADRVDGIAGETEDAPVEG